MATQLQGLPDRATQEVPLSIKGLIHFVKKELSINLQQWHLGNNPIRNVIYQRTQPNPGDREWQRLTVADIDLIHAEIDRQRSDRTNFWVRGLSIRQVERTKVKFLEDLVMAYTTFLQSIRATMASLAE